MGSSTFSVGSPREEWTAVHPSQWTSVLLDFLKRLRFKMGIIGFRPLGISIPAGDQLHLYQNTQQQRKNILCSHICYIFLPLARKVSSTMNKLSSVLMGMPA